MDATVEVCTAHVGVAAQDVCVVLEFPPRLQARPASTVAVRFRHTPKRARAPGVRHAQIRAVSYGAVLYVGVN